MKLLRYPEAAAKLGIAPMTLRRKVSLGQVPVMKPFGKRGRAYFSEEDLEAFLLASRRNVAN